MFGHFKVKVARFKVKVRCFKVKVGHFRVKVSRSVTKALHDPPRFAASA